MLSFLLSFFVQGRRFDRGDRTGDVFRSVGGIFDAPMSTATKAMAIIMLIGIVVFSAYLAIRLIKYIWHEGKDLPRG
jgi:hypothetical protein